MTSLISSAGNVFSADNVASADNAASPNFSPSLIAPGPAAAGRRRQETVRVLHVINGEHYAGAERVQDLLGLRLPQHGFDVSYACLKPKEFGPRRQSLRSPLYETPMRWRFDLRPAWTLAALVRQHGYRLIHTHTPRAALVGAIAARIAGVPMVHHVHGQTLTELRHVWRGKVSALVERTSIARAERVIAVSPSLVHYLERQGVDPRRVRLVPNGVPAAGEPLPSERGPLPSERRSLPSESGTHAHWTIGTVALFRPRKGTEMLLEAVAQLRNQGLNVRLRVVGPFETRSYEIEVKTRAVALGLQGHVDWIGFSFQVDRELAAMDLMVLPSLLAEGLPMVVIEAMAAGVPPVGTRVDGITDVIRHEVDGLLCEPRSEDLAAQLARVLRGEVDWRRLSAAAVARHRTHYSDETMAHGLAEVYREVLTRISRHGGAQTRSMKE